MYYTAPKFGKYFVRRSTWSGVFKRKCLNYLAAFHIPKLDQVGQEAVPDRILQAFKIDACFRKAHERSYFCNFT